MTDLQELAGFCKFGEAESVEALTAQLILAENLRDQLVHTKTGHIKRNCFAKRRTTQRTHDRTHHVVYTHPGASNGYTGNNSDHSKMYNLYTVNHMGPRTAPITVEVVVDGHNMVLEVDTDVAVTQSVRQYTINTGRRITDEASK